MIPYKINSRLKCHWRAALTFSVVGNFTVFVIAGLISNKQYGYTEAPENKLRWSTRNPGYKLHVLSNVAEWIMCFSFLWFSLTYIKEFQKIRITSDFVAEQERDALLSTLTLSDDNFINSRRNDTEDSTQFLTPPQTRLSESNLTDEGIK